MDINEDEVNNNNNNNNNNPNKENNNNDDNPINNKDNNNNPNNNNPDNNYNRINKNNYKNQINSKDSEPSKEFTILPSDSSLFDYNYKVIIIGDSGVGKTCLTYRATNGKFLERIAATVGFEYYQYFVKYQSKILKLEIWDTCGQETYRSLIKSFFNNSSLAIIVYAVDNRKSFSSIEEWIRQCRNLCAPDTILFLIANKNDVDDSEREIKSEEGEEVARRNFINLFLETSAKSGFNVDKLFCHAARTLYEDSIEKNKVMKVS